MILGSCSFLTPDYDTDSNKPNELNKLNESNSNNQLGGFGSETLIVLASEFTVHEAAYVIIH